MEQWTGLKLGKEDIKAVCCHPTCLTHMQSTSCKMLVWVSPKLESTARRGLPWWSRGWGCVCQCRGYGFNPCSRKIPHAQNHCSDCSHEIKRCLVSGRKAMTNPDSILKSRDLTSSTKFHLVKDMAFPVVMYRHESWTIKKAEPKELLLQTVVLEKTLESVLDSTEIKPVNPKGNQYS